MAALVAGLIFVSPAQALRVNFQSQGDSDKLTFSFDSGRLPKSGVARIGPKEISVSLPDGIWDTESKPGTKDYPGKLVESIAATPEGVRITTRTNAFGYIRLPIPGKPGFMLQLFRDPIGARWKSPVAKAVSKKPVEQPTPKPKPAAPVEASSPAPAVQGANGEHKPFFAVPYSVRNEVAAPDAPASPTQDQKQPTTPVESALPPESVQPVASSEPARLDVPREVESGVYPASTELRFKAVNKTAEQVKFAELAGDEAGRFSVADQRPVPMSGEGQVGGSVAPPPGQSPTQVQQPLAQQPVGISGAGQVGGAVAPPPTVVQGAPPPAPTPEETAEVEKTLEESQHVEQPVEQPVEMPQAEQSAPSEETVEPTVQAGDEAGQQAGLSPEEEEKARIEEIRNQLYEAQSLMFNGALDTALPIYEEILKQPKVPDDVREETLYAVADIKKQLNSGNLSGKFGEISQAFIEAMNANLRSNRVPRALLNLGLLNLQVGNFPEARAYFKILQEKYPDDDNIPSISYYWGEYFYKKGEFKKAADQFQYLIQTYPEHQLVKQAAYYLADSLYRTEFLDQAFQIVDYIDKRWPDYYMENMEFLRLAGAIEMELKKWKEAKNHYFTYYNLNPEAGRCRCGPCPDR